MDDRHIYMDDNSDIYYGNQSHYPTREDFVAAIATIQGDHFPTEQVVQVYARYCIADCGWHEQGAGDGFWHIDREPGRGRTKAWQYSVPRRLVR